MPQAVLVAAIPAAASIAGGVIASRSANKATKAQGQATADALGYQKSRDAMSDQRYQMAWDDYQRRHKAWEQRNFGGGGSGAPAAQAENMDPVAVAARAAVMQPGYSAQKPAGVAETMLGGPQEQQVAAPWNDWKPYLMGASNGLS